MFPIKNPLNVEKLRLTGVQWGGGDLIENVELAFFLVCKHKLSFVLEDLLYIYDNNKCIMFFNVSNLIISL